MGLVQDIAESIKSAYNAVEEMGGEIPEQRNLANLAMAVGSIPQGPAVPKSLEELKRMVNQGREIVIGTEIPDTYAGNDNPLIVAQNLNNINNVSYSSAIGVILVRKYVEPISQVFGSSNDYPNSTIKNFLDTTYLDNCSDVLKVIISSIGVQYYNGSSKIIVPGKWFLMSAYEMCNQGKNGAVGYEGIMWDYWKKQTGLSSPDTFNAANSGRITRDRDQAIRIAWLRSQSSNSQVCLIGANGNVGTYGPSDQIGVLPACFIGKD